MTGRVVLNGFLLLAVIVSVGASWIFSSDPTRPNFEFLPQMAHSPRYNTFAPNPNFADGTTLQRPEPGTIARGSMPLHYAATPQDALRAGEELTSPLDSGNLRARERGAFVFSNFCAVCHGAGGAGNGPVAQRGYPPPPSLLVDHALKMKDGQLFHVLTYGQNNMPSYASQLSPADRWNVILYVRTMQATAAPLPAPAAPSTSPLKAAQGDAAKVSGGQP
ncbi:MAG TPA: cytochrome c [Candidatus Sulfotelmatobacter sp.]|nr:cytochrome c [Candidatus Sulfotelmatobacter sp.]